MRQKIALGGLYAFYLALAGCGSSRDDSARTPVPAAGEGGPSAALTTQGKGPLLAVFGDSISTGVLANTELGKELDESLAQQLLKVLSGDLNDKAEVQSDLSNPELATASTEASYGIRASIAANRGLSATDVPVVNLAKFGAKSTDIPEMLARLESVEAAAPARKADIIFVMLGGNDFCSGQTIEEFATNYRRQVESIRASHPEASFVIAPVPPVDQMAAIDHTYGPSLPILEGEQITCRKLREKSCPRIYEADAAARVAGINSSILAVHDALQGAGVAVKWVQGIADWKIEPSDLAIDCFHPSVQGQEKIGKFISAAQP